MGNDRLAEGEDSLLDTHAATLDDDEVFVDQTVVREATHGVDGLLSEICLGGSRLGVSAVSDAVDLLVDLSSVVVTVLTGSWDSEGHSAWMPSSNTSDLTETLVSLSGQASGSPTSGHTFVSVTLSDTNDVDVLAFVEERVNLNLLLEERVSIVDLIGDGEYPRSNGEPRQW